MSKHMLITSSPTDFNLSHPGTGRVVCRPKLTILNDRRYVLNGIAPGSMYIRRPPVMIGYEDSRAAKEDAFFRSSWFITGDLGTPNHNRYLYFSDCSKEVINCGINIISPFKTEKVVLLGT
jgi:acyl-CoA synthetase (AMP-forming)/AMP-acid ligase II